MRVAVVRSFSNQLGSCFDAQMEFDETGFVMGRLEKRLMGETGGSGINEYVK
jgi:hypothetical protein